MFIFVALGGAFHMGVFGLLAGYIAGFLFLDRATGEFRLEIKGREWAWLIAGLSCVVFARFSSVFFEKLERVDSPDDLLGVMGGSGRAGSAYLTNVQIDSMADFFAFGGLKAIMLLVSPIPNQWRGANDIASFAFDGVVYFTAIVLIIRGLRARNSPSTQRLKGILTVLTIAAVGAVFVLGVGTSATGTAMRHRQKVQPILAVAVATAMTLDSKRSRSRRHTTQDVLVHEELPVIEDDERGR